MSSFLWTVRIIVLVFGVIGLITGWFFYDRLREANPRVAPRQQMLLLFGGVVVYGASAFSPLPWELLGELAGLAMMLPAILSSLRKRT
ncbi:hypothetical protein EPN52_05150 [bacterium]|nr:MAG: hypothetical protein EPN52_05150 [bacterium]